MSDSERYRAKADEMIRLAASALSRNERLGYLDLAGEWRKLAMEAARQAEGRIAPEGGWLPRENRILGSSGF
jgi:hypothetical protein